MRRLRKGSRVGKYRIESMIGSGGFARVYRARDMVEARYVALKVPDASLAGDHLSDLLKEVRIMVHLDHPHIVPILNADMVDGQLVIAYPLAEETLSARLGRRLGPKRGREIVEEVLTAAAYAHDKRIIHCDINPQNVLLFADGSAQLADFGLARVARKAAVQGSGSGTLGYIAPEQAMGRPSFRSDVFSLGLLAYRVFAGVLPTWPYAWPPAGHDRLRRRLTADAVAWIRRAIDPSERKRFANAGVMANSLLRIKRMLK